MGNKQIKNTTIINALPGHNSEKLHLITKSKKNNYYLCLVNLAESSKLSNRLTRL